MGSGVLVTSERCEFKDKVLGLPQCHSLILLRRVHGGNGKGGPDTGEARFLFCTPK